MSNPRVHQLLLTRFNIRTAGVGYKEDQSPDWLEERFTLFARYCAPSIAAQTEEDFDWIIFCDEFTPDDVLDRIRAFDPRIRIALFVAPKEVTPDRKRRPEGVVSTLRAYPHVRPGTEVVVATRLDNDDALSRHALRRARDHVEQFLETGHPQWLYNPLLGFKLDHQTQRLFPAEKPNSAFLTMFERVVDGQQVMGPFAGNHSRMHEVFPTFQDDGARLWLMVIHGGNVLNGIGARDVEVPIASLGDDFAIRL